MSDRPVVLSFADIVLAPGKPALSGEIRAGEIVGLAGLEGHGQEQFLLALAGLGEAAGARLEVRQADGTMRGYRNHHAAARHGVVYLPRDRRAAGIFPALSVLDNFGLPSMPRFSVAGILDRRRQQKRFADYTDFLSIRYPSVHAPITALSGGNQQKVLLARLLALEPRVMLLNDPTRGVDLNTRLKFYEAFRSLSREKGISLVVLSSEIEEILQVCDRVGIFRDHEVAATLSREAMSMSAVLSAMFGQKEVVA